MKAPVRGLVVLAVLALAAQGCIGRSRPGATAPVAAVRSDSVARAAADSAAIATPPVALDSATQARMDSVTAARLRDSVLTARVATVADSVLKADSAKARRVVAKAAPASRQCVLDFSESTPETRFQYQTLPNETITGIGGGFIGHCQGENNRIRADSAEQYTAAGVVNLFGNVSYEEPGKLRFTSNHATYFTRDQRLLADGNVTATQLASGSTFTGPNIEYLRPLAGVRTTSRLIAPNRPTARIIEKDSTGKPGAPIEIVANTMTDEGDTLVFAWGMVHIVRNRLIGDGDSASYDKLTERARLIRQAKVTNGDSAQPFTLVGDTIDLFSRDRTVERVLSQHKAIASNDDFTMQSERIDLRLVSQKLDRAYASGEGVSQATTPQQELVADSIDIHLPNQRITEVRAIGSAVATGVPDTLKLKSEDRDALRGDSVIARFDTLRAAGDTGTKARVKEIEAQGNASSFFQVASKLGPSFPPAVNYLRAQMIVVDFDSGTVQRVRADSSASGVYLEPDTLSDSTSVRRGAAGSRQSPAARQQDSSAARAGTSPGPQETPKPVPPPVPPPVTPPVSPIKRPPGVALDLLPATRRR